MPWIHPDTLHSSLLILPLAAKEMTACRQSFEDAATYAAADDRGL